MFAHTELCPFTRHGSRQSPQRLFSDVVVDGAGMRVDADERALVDDPAPAFGLHVRKGSIHGPFRAERVDLEISMKMDLGHCLRARVSSMSHRGKAGICKHFEPRRRLIG